ncbi:MAG: hypothetical protein ABW122_16320 [Ilumatobacteraceae bacterium]
MADWFQREIVDDGQLAVLLLLVSFVVTFVATRLITRTIRAGRGPFKDNVSHTGVHVHHAVPGIILLVVGSFTIIATDATTPWFEICAVLVGIGTSLVLDEFALILHLQDVYWTDEGRISVQLVALAAACLGLFLLGYNPVNAIVDDDEVGTTVVATSLTVGLHLVFILLCVVKGKYKVALFGAFLPFFAVVAALRLARPTSRWATHRYSPDKMAEATARAAAQDARYGPFTRWLSDFIGGKPSEPDPPPAPVRQVTG